MILERGSYIKVLGTKLKVTGYMRNMGNIIYTLLDEETGSKYSLPQSDIEDMINNKQLVVGE